MVGSLSGSEGPPSVPAAWTFPTGQVHEYLPLYTFPRMSKLTCTSVLLERVKQRALVLHHLELEILRVFVARQW